MAKFILIIMAVFFGNIMARDIISDIKENTLQYFSTLGVGFYAYWKSLTVLALDTLGVKYNTDLMNGEIGIQVIKTCINSIESILTAIIVLILTHLWHKYFKKKL